MKKKSVAPLALFFLLVGYESSAADLADLIPGLYGGDGIFLATSPLASHTAHFGIDSTASINRLNEQIASEIGLFPFSSSVGGFTFEFAKELGTFVRTTETLGPLFAERAATLGRGKFNFHVSLTYFKYDEFSGDSLDGFPVVAQHEPDVIGLPDVREQFELDTILIDVDLDIRVRILSLTATYGITDRLDVGILVPLADVDMDVKATAQAVESPGNTLFPGVHTFVGGPESPDDAASDSATGLGDVVLRAKYHWHKSDTHNFAGALVVKTETGDEKDFLGTGDATVRPFVIYSRSFGRFVPHVNFGFEFNLDDSDKNSVEYAIGFDYGKKKLTVAADIIGSSEPSGDDIGDDIVDGAVGVKWSPVKKAIFSANVLFPLNDSGLRSDLITTLAFERSF